MMPTIFFPKCVYLAAERQVCCDFNFTEIPSLAERTFTRELRNCLLEPDSLILEDVMVVVM